MVYIWYPAIVNSNGFVLNVRVFGTLDMGQSESLIHLVMQVLTIYFALILKSNNQACLIW